MSRDNQGPRAITRAFIELYDEYTHAPLDRRTFMDRLSRLAGGTAAALAILPILENNYAHAALVAPDDPALKAEKIGIANGADKIDAYMARPADGKPAPGVIVIHENRGLNAHIEDVARRLAKAGYVAVAPDLLSPLGGTPKDEDAARDLISKLDPLETVAALRAVFASLTANPATTGKAGVVGFCWGGGMTNRFATAEPKLGAAVAYYGPPASPADVPKIKAPLMLHYAGLDKRINDMVVPYLEALSKEGKPFEKFVYDNVDHAFNNDTATARYNAEAAALAWGRTLGFFKQQLS